GPLAAAPMIAPAASPPIMPAATAPPPRQCASAVCGETMAAIPRVAPAARAGNVLVFFMADLPLGSLRSLCIQRVFRPFPAYLRSASTAFVDARFQFFA